MEKDNIAFEKQTDSRRTSQNNIEDSPIDMMDGALAFVNGIVDLNIEMQQLYIEIRKKLVQKESNALDFIHYAIKRIQAIKKQMDQKSNHFQSIEAGNLISRELFLRFYSRVSEKIFKKFLYYSLNSHALDFTAKGLLQLYNIQQEMASPNSNLKDFKFFSRISNMILVENEDMASALLQIAVDQNYITSAEEFFRMRMLAEQKSNCIIEEESSDENQGANQDDNQGGNQSNASAKSRKRKSLKGTRDAKVHKTDFKRQLDLLLHKYQDNRVRDSFMSNISNDIQKDADKFIANQKIEEQTRKTLKKKSRCYGKKGSDTSRGSILRKGSSVTFRGSIVRDANNSVYSIQPFIQVNLNMRNKPGKNEDFFVGTHVPGSSSAGFVHDSATTSNDTFFGSLLKPIDMEDLPTEIKMKPLVGALVRQTTPKHNESDKHIRFLPRRLPREILRQSIAQAHKNLRIGQEDQYLERRDKFKYQSSSLAQKSKHLKQHDKHQASYKNLMEYMRNDKWSANNQTTQRMNNQIAQQLYTQNSDPEDDMATAIDRILIKCGLMNHKENRVNSEQKKQYIKKDIKKTSKNEQTSAWSDLLTVDMINTTASKYPTQPDSEVNTTAFKYITQPEDEGLQRSNFSKTGGFKCKKNYPAIRNNNRFQARKQDITSRKQEMMSRTCTAGYKAFRKNCYSDALICDPNQNIPNKPNFNCISNIKEHSLQSRCKTTMNGESQRGFHEIYHPNMRLLFMPVLH